MIWSFLFIISIAQGVFLISLLGIKHKQNKTATYLVAALILLMIITNADFFLVTSRLYKVWPFLFGMSFGMMLLFGPLLYFYTRSVVDTSFTWKPKYYLHFGPYLLKFFTQLPLYTLPAELKKDFIELYLSGSLQLRDMDAIVFCLESLHLLIYLIVSVKEIKSMKLAMGNATYIISITSRIKWVTVLFYCFTLFLITVIVALAYTLIQWKYIPASNYLYTMVSSATLFVISYKFALDPDLISPSFNHKYQFTKKIDSEERDELIAKLNQLISVEKIHLQQELKLNLMAEKMGIPGHQLSKLINEKYQKSFNEFINELRIKEFIERINDDKYRSYSLYGIAMDVGFSSKSSFNNIFKKVTGKTPSEYKKY